jgi:hypothetical protein
MVFLKKCKSWFLCLADFFESDATWTCIKNTKERVAERWTGLGEGEALMSAIDKRRYKLYGLIPWTYIETQYDNGSSNNNEQLKNGEDVASKRNKNTDGTVKFTKNNVSVFKAIGSHIKMLKLSAIAAGVQQRAGGEKLL